MTVKELLTPLYNGTPVQIHDGFNEISNGTAFGLFTTLRESVLATEVESFRVRADSTLVIEITCPKMTNYDKLKEVFPDIERRSAYDSGCEVVVGLDISTKFRSDWLNAEYEGSEDE